MASEYTEHFNLDLYTDNDRPNLRDQYNAAIRKIDNKLFEQVTTINLLDNVVDNLKDDVEQMQSDLSDEVTARTNADTALGARIDNETAARESADQTLTTNLTTEVTAREGADTTLDNKITAETTARTNADTAIGTRIDGVETSVSGLATDLQTEATARANADSQIISRLDNLSTHRKVVIIGDSYLSQSTPFITEDVARQCNAEFIKTSMDYDFNPGGCGFLTGSRSYQTQIDLFVERMTSDERAAITDVVFAGGWNDGNHWYDNEGSNIGTARAMIRSARNAFPNARVLLYYMYCGAQDYKGYSNGRKRNFGIAANYYRELSNLEGCGFGWCNSAPYLTNASNDGQHPNSNGFAYLRPVLINLINNGNAKDFVLGNDGFEDIGDIYHSKQFVGYNFNYTVDVTTRVSSTFFNTSTIMGVPQRLEPMIGTTASGYRLGWIMWILQDNQLHYNVQSSNGGVTFTNGQGYFQILPVIKRYDPAYFVQN